MDRLVGESLRNDITCTTRKDGLDPDAACRLSSFAIQVVRFRPESGNYKRSLRRNNVK